MMLPDAALQPGPAFGRIKALVIARTLHHYYEDKDALLAERVQRRLQALGLGEAGYLALLQGGAGSEAEWATLEAEITIGETFFFRFAEQFAALHDTILPTLIRARAGSRTLRIWSAGCASGAEPYSVAILLHRLLGDRLADWKISITGTDISEAALDAARAATYGDWALRSLSEAERRRDFLPVAGSGGRRWTLRPSYRAMVRFERQNLLGLLDGPASLHHGYDLVLCRNVLIYFHVDRVQALVRRFGETLAMDGWLLLGHAEAAGFEAGGLRAVPLDGAVAWMRAGPAAMPVVVASPARAAPRTARAQAVAGAAGVVPVMRARAGIEAAVRARAGTAAAGQAAAGTEAAAVEQVRAMADAGDPQAAMLLCRQLLSRHPLSAPLFLYAGVLQRVLGHEEGAEADFRRAIYLRNQFAMAHYNLGLLLIDAGRLEPARRAIAEAGLIARNLPDDHVLECGDGMTAARLRALARLDWLPAGQASS